MADVEVRTIVITMHYSLAQTQLEVAGDTLLDVETDALADTLPDTLAELRSETDGETITDMNIGSQV